MSPQELFFVGDSLLNDVIHYWSNAALCVMERRVYYVSWRLLNHGRQLVWDKIFYGGFHSPSDHASIFSIKTFLMILFLYRQFVVGCSCRFAGPRCAVVVQRCFACRYRYIVVSGSPRRLQRRIMEVHMVASGFIVSGPMLGWERVDRFILYTVCGFL